MDPIRSIPELYAHALAMEEEAAQRYVELAVRMHDEGQDALAELFWRLGRTEGEHYTELLRRTEAMVLPPLPAERYRWLQHTAPDTAAHDLVLRLMTPRHALAIALEAERRARDFFIEAARSAADPRVRALARDMAAEENEHIVQLLAELERAPVAPATATEWERLFIDSHA
jgi:rubrerythrin